MEVRGVVGLFDAPGPATGPLSRTSRRRSQPHAVLNPETEGFPRACGHLVTARGRLDGGQPEGVRKVGHVDRYRYTGGGQGSFIKRGHNDLGRVPAVADDKTPPARRSPAAGRGPRTLEAVGAADEVIVAVVGNLTIKNSAEPGLELFAAERGTGGSVGCGVGLVRVDRHGLAVHSEVLMVDRQGGSHATRTGAGRLVTSGMHEGSCLGTVL